MSRSRPIDLQPQTRPPPDDVIFVHIDYQPQGFIARIRVPGFAIVVHPTDAPLQAKEDGIRFARKFIAEFGLRGRLVWSFYHDPKSYDDYEV